MPQLHGDQTRHLARVFLGNPLWGPPAEQLRSATLAATSWPSHLEFILGHKISPTHAVQVLETSHQDRTISLSSESFDYAWVADRPGSSLPTAEFADEASRVLGSLLEILGLRGNRIAFVREGMVADAIWPISTSPKWLLSLPTVFQSHTPFEWNWRCASKILRHTNGQELVTNTIASLARIEGKWLKTNERFDRVRADLDVNTDPHDARIRFDANDTRAFIKDAERWLNDLEAEVFHLLADAKRESN